MEIPTAAEFPNPSSNPSLCGTAEPSWLCDPYGIFDHVSQPKALGLIGDYRRRTRAPCSSRDGSRTRLMIAITGNSWFKDEEELDRWAKELFTQWDFVTPICNNGLLIVGQAEPRLLSIQRGAELDPVFDVHLGTVYHSLYEDLTKNAADAIIAALETGFLVAAETQAGGMKQNQLLILEIVGGLAFVIHWIAVLLLRRTKR